MKKILYAAMLLLGLNILCSCNKENNGSSGSIIGEWQSTKRENIFQGSVVGSENQEEIRLTFYDDNILTLNSNGNVPTMRYQYDEKMKVLSFGGMQFEIFLSSKILTLSRKMELYKALDKEYKAAMYKGTQIYCDGEYSPSNFWYYKGDEKIPVGKAGNGDYFYEEIKIYFSRVK
ncbi:MAG: hypothetical protein MJY48_03330 [Bacteroidales bacterium]|nr:hypothetical protein [Bacteroidales bacterium]